MQCNLIEWAVRFNQKISEGGGRVLFSI